MTRAEAIRSYEFGGFRLDPERRLLFGRDGEAIALKPKVFDTLLHFVEHAGQLVNKEELMRAVWGDVVVEENSLNQHVSALRHVFGETPGENRFIVTIPGRGYRFVVTVRGLAPGPGESDGANDEPAPTGPAPAAGAGSGSRAARRYAGIGLVGFAAFAALLWFWQPGEQAAAPSSGAALPLNGWAPPAVVRFRVDIGPGERLSGGLRLEGNGRPSRPSFAFSPDGRHLVYAASDGETTRLYRRPMDRQVAAAIPGTEGASQPFFSPDGLWVAFFAGTELKRVALEGGDVRTIAASEPFLSAENRKWSSENLTASWTENDTILVSGERGIYELPAHGGRLVELTEGGQYGNLEQLSIGFHLHPRMLPGRRTLLFNVANSLVPSEWDIVVDTLDGTARKVVIDGGSHPRYVPSGHIVFARHGALLAVAFDVDRLEAMGAPVVVVENVMHGEGGHNTGLNLGAAQFSVANAGALAYVPGGIYPGRAFSIVWVDRSGIVEPLPLPPASYWWPRFSPDGTKLSYAVGEFGDKQLWVYDIGLEIPVALTSAGHNAEPIWSPDGRKLAFYRVAPDGGLFSMPADGSEPPQRIAAGLDSQPSSWSIDDVLVFVEGGNSLWTLDMRGKEQPTLFLQTSSESLWPDFSPDGKWMAYVSNETGQYEVYVRPFPKGTPAQRISSDGGTEPLWSRDGRELFYRSSDPASGVPRVMVVDVATEPTFTRTRPRLLFEAADLNNAIPVRFYDVSPDGRRFVFLTPAGQLEPQRVTGIDIVLNWFEELEERAPAR